MQPTCNKSETEFIDSGKEVLRRLRVQKNWHEADRLAEERITVAEKLVRSHDSAVNRRLLASTYCGLAFNHLLQNRKTEAECLYDEARQLRQSTFQSGLDATFQIKYAQACVHHGRVLMDLGRYAKALEVSDEASRVFHRLNSCDSHVFCAYSIHNVAKCQLELGDLDSALKSCERSAANYTALLPSQLTKTKFVQNLAGLAILKSKVLERLNNTKQALHHLRYQIELFESCIELRQYSGELSMLYLRLIELLRNKEDNAERITVRKALLKLTRDTGSAEDSPRQLAALAADCNNCCRFSDALNYSIQAERLQVEHLRNAGLPTEDETLLNTIRSNKSACESNARRHPDARSRRATLAQIIDTCNVTVFPGHERCKTTAEWMAYEGARSMAGATCLWVSLTGGLGLNFTEHFLTMVLLTLVGLFLIGPRLSIPFLKKLADGFESRYLSSTARRAQRSLPTTVSWLLIDSSGRQVRFRLWAIGIAYFAAFMFELSTHYFGDEGIAEWIRVACVPKRIIEEQLLRLLVATIKVSLAHSARRLFFPMLPRGTHLVRLGNV